MIEFSRLTVLIVAELLLGLSLLSGMLIIFAAIRKNKIRKAAQHLIERIKHDMQPRVERLKNKLIDDYAYAGEVLEQSLHDLIKAEKQLYQNIINGFLMRNVIAFQQIDVDVENLVAAYQGLKPPKGEAVTTAETQETIDESEEMQRLEAENQRLSDELQVTMDTMGRMLNEYATMLSGGASGQPDSESFVGLSPQVDVIPTEGEVESPAQDQILEGDQSSTSVGLDIEIEEGIGPGPLDDFNEELSESGVGFDDPGAIEMTEAEEAVTQTEEDSVLAVDMDEQAIEEVLEVDDDLTELAGIGLTPEPESKPVAVTESLVDELEQVDIPIPEADNTAANETIEPGSLEDEWAKLLEEDAKSTEDEGLNGQIRES